LPSHDTAAPTVGDNSSTKSGAAHPDRRLLIDGQLVTTDRTFPSLNPATGDVIGHVPDAGTGVIESRGMRHRRWERKTFAIPAVPAEGVA
jgi:aldehyde dehydrogenase (NAD+)